MFPAEIIAWIGRLSSPKWLGREQKAEKGEIPPPFPTSLIELEHLTLPSPAAGTGICAFGSLCSQALGLGLNYTNTFLGLQLAEDRCGTSSPPLSHKTWLGIYFVNAHLTRNPANCSLCLVGTELTDIFLCSQSGTAAESGQWNAESEVCHFHVCSPNPLQNLLYFLSFLTSQRHTSTCWNMSELPHCWMEGHPVDI